MKRRLFSILGIFFSTVPPLSAVISYFTLWSRSGSVEAFCGFSLFLIFISVLPFYRRLREILKSPSVTTLWFCFFIIFFLLSKIADEVTVISFIGFISNLIGSLFFKLARRGQNNEGKT